MLLYDKQSKNRHVCEGNIFFLVFCNNQSCKKLYLLFSELATHFYWKNTFNIFRLIEIYD